MSLPYVELSHKPEKAYSIAPLPGSRLLLAFVDQVEELEPTEEGTQRWRAVVYTMAVPQRPGLAQRIEARPQAWLERAKAEHASRAAADARKRRDELLAACDYTAATDYPATDTERDAWRRYRQALRDIPEQAGFPWAIVWPDKPGREKAADTLIAAIDTMLGGADE